MRSSSGREVKALRADGGASSMDLLLQLQSDQLRVPVSRPKVAETTALGAAFLAGLAEGVWSSLEEIGAIWALDAEFQPEASADEADRLYDRWQRAVERSRAWSQD
jgi:glycerol kinase